MATLKTLDAASNICKKGFTERTETHHKYYHFYYGGQKTLIKTFMSHGSKELDDYLQSQMAKQLKLRKQDFVRFVNCEITEKDYIKHLKANGYL